MSATGYDTVIETNIRELLVSQSRSAVLVSLVLGLFINNDKTEVRS